MIKFGKKKAWKIKSVVDLKELKNFGYEVFEFDPVANKPFDVPVCRKLIKRTSLYTGLALFIEDRTISLREFCMEGFTSTLKVKRKYIRDLRKAKLVEKVVKQ